MFNPKIFRDTPTIDYAASPMSVIFKVMRYGSLDDVKQLPHVYDTLTMKRFLRTQHERIDLGEQKLLSLLIAAHVVA